MDRLIIHPSTRQRLDSFITKPSHALIMFGSRGMGKKTLGRSLAAILLEISEPKLFSHPYFTKVEPDTNSIGIERIREIDKFISLKVPSSNATNKISRIVIIEDADLLTVEAQNALLKNLEEPPSDTFILLETSNPKALLPTILSRAQQVEVKKPSAKELKAFLLKSEAEEEKVDQAMLMSGGLPGLAHTLISDVEDHPLVEAAQIARQILQNSLADRLSMVDLLAKDKLKALNVLAILQQMAQLMLLRESNTQVKKWQDILSVSYTASMEISRSVQPKLVLTNMMLSM